MTTAIAVTKEMIEAVAWSASPQEGMPWGMILDDKAIENILSIGLANCDALTPHGEEAADPAPSTQKQGVTPEAEARDAGISFGIAMSVAFLIRDRDEPSLAREWWEAAGLTIEQCERVGLDDYDLAPIRAALASEASE